MTRTTSEFLFIHRYVKFFIQADLRCLKEYHLTDPKSAH